MKLNSIFNIGMKALRDNSHSILTGFGVSGTITTAYLAGKGAYKSAFEIYDAPAWLTYKEKAKLTWKNYIPAAASGALTIGCIVGGARIGSKRTAAAYSLLTVSEKAFTEYKDKVVDQIGEKKEKALRDDIVKDNVAKNPPAAIVVGSGTVLCREAYSGRYFMSDVETLKKAVNEINAKMVRETGASLWDFYYEVGLPSTTYCHQMGWESCKLLELDFTAVMSEDGRPCISFDYNYIEPF